MSGGLKEPRHAADWIEPKGKRHMNVRDAIAEILKREGPMTKEDVVDKVLKERYLKKNTILVNLQNPKYFRKNKDKTYSPL